jgi:hypothetical protein
MRLTSAMLADAAQVTAGKLYVLGGGIDMIGVRSFPALIPSLSVVLVAEMGPGDRNRDLEFSITLVNEDGRPMGVGSRGTVRVGDPSLLPAGSFSSVPLVGTFNGLRFEKPGGYVFAIEHDGKPIGRLPFRIRETA